MEHEEPCLVRLAPGKRAELIWQLTEPGELPFGRPVPGHADAGMKGRIRVIAHPGQDAYP